MWSIWVRDDSCRVRQHQALYWLLLWSFGNEPNEASYKSPHRLPLNKLQNWSWAKTFSGQPEGVPHSLLPELVGKQHLCPVGNSRAPKCVLCSWLGTNKTLYSMEISSEKLSWKHYIWSVPSNYSMIQTNNIKWDMDIKFHQYHSIIKYCNIKVKSNWKKKKTNKKEKKLYVEKSQNVSLKLNEIRQSTVWL